MELSSLPSLNNLSVVSNISSGIHFIEDIFFWERLKFDWVSNLNSLNDFAFTLLEDDHDVLLMAHSDINILKHLLFHWKDLANRHSNFEKLTAAEYKFIYYDSLKCSSNIWEFLQLEFMKTEQEFEIPHIHKANLNRSQSYQLEKSEFKTEFSILSKHSRHSCDISEKFNEKLSWKSNSISFDQTPDTATLDFLNFISSLNQNLALFLLIEGPKTIPPQFRNIYKNLMQILCKTHSSFLPTIMQMKKNYRLRPIEYEGSWEADATCNICFETYGAFMNRCCDMIICERCFTYYLNFQVSSLNRIHVECPASNCNKPIRFQSIWVRLSESSRGIYENMKNNQQQTEFMKLCPHCMKFYELSGEQKVQMTHKKYKKLYKKGFNVKCRMCNWEWCFKCQTPVHNLTCKKNLSTDKLLMKWANSPAESIQNNMKKARKCPKCNILVERNGGCPHMECSKCKCSWCYDCGRRRIKLKHIPFMNHDSRFFILGCSKNLLANKPHLRRFVRMCVFCGITVLIIPATAVAGVILVALGILLGIPFGCYMIGVKIHQCSCSGTCGNDRD